MWICTALPLLVLIVCEPAYLQSATLLCIGITLLLLFLRTRGARAATFGWGLLVGCAGFFFEVFATGGVLPEFAVWRYDPEIQRAVVARGAWQVPVPRSASDSERGQPHSTAPLPRQPPPPGRGQGRLHRAAPEQQPERWGGGAARRPGILIRAATQGPDR